MKKSLLSHHNLKDPRGWKKNQDNPGINQGNQQDNLEVSCLDKDVVTIIGVQHPLQSNPHKFLLKFDLDFKQPVKDHIKVFMLDITKKNVRHEDLFCILFP